VGEAEGRARAAEERAKEIEQRAEARRIESERHATDTIEKSKALADKTVNDARAEAHRVLSEARSEAELTTGAARRELEDLTRQKNAVTSQLGQMLSGLAGIVPGQGGPRPTASRAADQENQLTLRVRPADQPAVLVWLQRTDRAGLPHHSLVTSRVGACVTGQGV
jgi:hypothetical protein